MKNIKKSLLLALIYCTAHYSMAQSINWKNLKQEDKHIITLHTGWDYGVVFGAGYGYQLKSKMPVLLTVNYSFPSGKELLDDFKTKAGAQMRLYAHESFQLSASVHAIYRRYENPLVRLQNIGTALSITGGYYKPKWFVAGEFGFDKAIVTHFKHSDSFKENIYADVKNGWYEPTTGGNVTFGLLGGYSFKQHDITLKMGKVVTQDFKTTPLIPFYLQLGYNIRIGGDI